MYFLLCELPKKARRCRDEPYVFWYDNIYGYQPRDVFNLEPCHHQMLCMQFFIFLKDICSGCKSIYYFPIMQIFSRLF